MNRVSCHTRHIKTSLPDKPTLVLTTKFTSENTQKTNPKTNKFRKTHNTQKT